MQTTARWVLISVGVLVAGLPAAVVATLLLLPFWSWLEANFGIESVGHSGPVEWCYLAAYIVIAGGALALIWKRNRRPGIRGRPGNSEALH
jgi:hypothetical protein